MQDFYVVLATAALFAVAIIYVAGCDRLKAGTHHD